MVILSCFYWLSKKKELEILNSNLNNPLIFKFSSIMFFFLFSIVLMSLYLSYLSMERSLLYFILVSIMAGILFIGIIYVPTCLRTNLYLLLTEIVLYGLLLTYSQLYLVPGIIGVDTWYHQMLSQKIISIFHIPQNFLYTNFPIFHLLISNSTLLTNLDYKLAAALSVSFSQVVLDVITLFLISKLILGDEKIGLLAGLLLITSNVHLSMGFAPIPNALGLPLFLIVIYILFKDKKIESKVLILLLMLVIVLNHSIAALLTSIILFMGSLVYWIYNRFYDVNIDKSVQFNITIFFIVLMFTWWIYASGILYDLVSVFKWGFSLDMAISKPELYFSNVKKVPFIESILTNLGMFIFFALSLIGSFFMLSNENRTSKTFFWTIIGLFLLGICFLAIASGAFIVTERWIYFAFAILSIPLAISFFMIISINPKKHFNFKLSISVLFIILLTFFMVLSPEANKDNDQLFPNTLIKTSLKTSELTAVGTVTTFWPGYIGSDNYYSDSVIHNLGHKSSSIDYQIYKKNITLNNTLILIRTRMYTENIDIYGPYKIDYEIESLLEANRFILIYDSGSVEGFLKIKT